MLLKTWSTHWNQTQVLCINVNIHVHMCCLFVYVYLSTCLTAIIHSHDEITITEEDVDKEEVYKMASVLAEGDGLKVMLTR